MKVRVLKPKEYNQFVTEKYQSYSLVYNLPGYQNIALQIF